MKMVSIRGDLLYVLLASYLLHILVTYNFKVPVIGCHGGAYFVIQILFVTRQPFESKLSFYYLFDRKAYFFWANSP